MIHPLVLGTGPRLSTDKVEAMPRLAGSVASDTGMVVATYESPST